MTDVRTLPVSSVYHEWEGIDTSIDSEAPELLSEEQLTRYSETVATLLRALGLWIRTPDEGDPTRLEITSPTTGHTVELDLYDDRSAEWSLTGAAPEGTSASRLASTMAALLTVDSQN
ncbi:hypothetical protein [Salinactinospora qingdaonensis]|uniref:Uncharacterized protein n=1 Tax=Salinactinospora qingdaonensis TaxID=702744 RepID=A0ABP7G6J2_9ACTN